ncbi:MAG: hypothetical protein JOZ49_20825 [Mycolicibacterium sp.]|nr:hypothetical protein [Mycolicibacterium sp.]
MSHSTIAVYVTPAAVITHAVAIIRGQKHADSTVYQPAPPTCGSRWPGAAS